MDPAEVDAVVHTPSSESPGAGNVMTPESWQMTTGGGGDADTEDDKATFTPAAPPSGMAITAVIRNSVRIMNPRFSGNDIRSMDR